LEIGKNYFCAEKIDHKPFFIDNVNDKILINCAKEIKKLHDIKINKNTKIKTPNFLDT
jgi:hypothetical protein